MKQGLLQGRHGDVLEVCRVLGKHLSEANFSLGAISPKLSKYLRSQLRQARQKEIWVPKGPFRRNWHLRELGKKMMLTL